VAGRAHGPSEAVVVFRRTLLDELGYFEGIHSDWPRYLLEIIEGQRYEVVRREEAEKDFRYKQLVAYMVVRFDDRFLAYKRGVAGGEARLEGMKSVGAGGHIVLEGEAMDLARYRGEAWERASGRTATGLHLLV
jgi:predicted NUDIX family phosphoesterase